MVAETVTFADILVKFPSAKPSLANLIQLLPVCKPRYYSIASSQRMIGEKLELCIVLVDWVTPSGQSGSPSVLVSHFGCRGRGMRSQLRDIHSSFFFAFLPFLSLLDLLASCLLSHCSSFPCLFLCVHVFRQVASVRASAPPTSAERSHQAS